MLNSKEAWKRFKRDIIVNVATIGFLLISIEVGILTIISQSINLMICFVFIILLTILSSQISASHSTIIDKFEENKKLDENRK